MKIKSAGFHFLETVYENYLDLRFLPLFDIGFVDLEVDTFDTFAATHDFDTSKERLKVVQNATGSLQESSQPNIHSHNIE